MSILNEVEDYFQNEGCFVSGINGRKSYMDSYMTILDFEKFDQAISKCNFSKNQLLCAANEMLHFNYLSPMAGLLAKSIHYKLCPIHKICN